jgi:predicted nucleic acid-binding protein
VPLASPEAWLRAKRIGPRGCETSFERVCGRRPWLAERLVLVRALADTGALLAYLDRSDRWHGPCRAAFAGLRLPMVTSSAVLTELFHLVGDNRRQMQTTWEFVRSGALTVATLTDRDLSDLEELMRRYHDRPMDFADATLVHVAARESLSTVFTVDHDDFETYRIGGRKRFRILPARP